MKPGIIAIVVLSLASMLLGCRSTPSTPEAVRVTIDEMSGALANPLKGFTIRGFWEENEWATLGHSYIRWNDIENDIDDGIDKILDWCDENWQQAEERNIKVIPRVFLHWDGDYKYWPADMSVDDYSSAQFEERVVRLVQRLGVCWDNDPRVAHIEMGLIGKWGEHHSPSITPEMQEILGTAFTNAFSNKKVLIRHPWDFEDFSFGIYWDSWAHYDQMDTHGLGIEDLGDRWKTEIIGGEVAYNWGNYQIQPGDSPTDTVSDISHRQFFIDTIRRLHCTQLRWVAAYDHSIPEARAGGEEVQKAFGYRYVIQEAHFYNQVDADAEFLFSFSVMNTGSAPFYYEWPLELALLDMQTKERVWGSAFSNVDIRDWLPGDDWDEQNQDYAIKPLVYTVTDTFAINDDVAAGEYYLALTILDPANMMPAVRFANENNIESPYQVIGRVGVGVAPDSWVVTTEELVD